VPRPGRLPTGQLAGLLAWLPPVRIRRGTSCWRPSAWVLRRFTDADLDLLVELDGDPEVMRSITGGRPTSREELRDEVLPAFLRYYRRIPGYGAHPRLRGLLTAAVPDRTVILR
jgi:hypothetical protein